MLKFKLRRKSVTKKQDLSYINKKTPLWKPLLFFLPGLGILIFFTILPFLDTINSSFLPLENEHKAASGSFGFSGYTDIFQDPYFTTALSNSLLYAFLAIPISVFISLLVSASIASVMHKYLRGFLQTIFFLPYVTSGVAVSLTFIYFFDSTGLFNEIFDLTTPWLENVDSMSAFWVILVRGIWGDLAFQILIFTTAMLGINKDLYKAASIDGAGFFKKFFNVTLPSIRRTLSFIITVGLIGAIKVFPLALFEMDPSAAKIYGGFTLLMYVYEAISVGDFVKASAASAILVVVAISFSIVVRNAISAVGWLVNKGGEVRVKVKIKHLK